jgi:hypothetical protein
VASRLLGQLTYTIMIADKGYVSRDLEADLAKNAVDFVTSYRHLSVKKSFIRAIVL